LFEFPGCGGAGGGRAAGVGESNKTLRTMAATTLERHEVYGRSADYFLAHAPRTVAGRHYVRPSDEQFFAALDWLRAQLLGSKSSSRPLQERSRRQEVDHYCVLQLPLSAFRSSIALLMTSPSPICLPARRVAVSAVGPILPALARRGNSC
jgi:hypothetical protein